MKHAVFAVLAACIAVAPAVSAQQQDPLAGRWTGSMTLGDNEHPINIWFEGARSSKGRFQIIGLTSDRNQIQNVHLAGTAVTFDLPSRPPQRFRARLASNRMSGTITIGGSTETFSVLRMK